MHLRDPGTVREIGKRYTDLELMPQIAGDFGSVKYLFTLSVGCPFIRCVGMTNRTDDHTASASARADDAPLVLVIDDSPAMAESLAMMLEDHGFRVLTAENGFRGLQVFREKRPAVVLIDILMPEKDGIETILEMRRSDPGAKIIAVSGRLSGWNYLRIAQELGADAGFEKGRDPAHLIETLNRLLEQQ